MNAAWHDARVNFAAHPLAWPLARGVRKLGSVVRVPGLGVVINDAEVAHDVFMRDDVFTKNGPRSLAASFTEILGPVALGNMDGEAHRTLRSKLTDLLSPMRAKELLVVCEPMIARMTNDLAAGRVVDLVAFMRLLSGRITFEMLGITHSDNECLALVALGARIASGVDFRQPSARRMARMHADVAQLATHIRSAYESTTVPARSFIRRLRDTGLTFDETRGVISLVFLAGTLTTAAALPRIVALLVDGGHFDRLFGERGGIPAAISEGLRYAAPIPATVRIAQRDAMVGGKRVAAGERLVILTCNLARDPGIFPDPDTFDPSRKHDPRSRYLWYGAGPHFCLGFAIAQRQLQLVLAGVLDGGASLRVVARHAARNVVVPAYTRLLVTRG